MGVLEEIILDDIVEEIYKNAVDKLENAFNDDERLDILDEFKAIPKSASNILGEELEKRGFNLMRMKRSTFEWAINIFIKAINWKIVMLATLGYSEEEILYNRF